MNDNLFDTIGEAFSRTAEKYDAFALDHPNQTRMRNKVYAHLNRFLEPGARILEINAGTGIDAVELARRGFFVHATDIAHGMLKRAQDKIESSGLNERITIQECSFTELKKINNAPFDAVFSNLGGLNCVPDLRPIIQQLPIVIKPNGLITWVLMPPICLWEMAEIFRGQPQIAFRRFSKNGTRAHLEGLYFPVHYFKPKKVTEWFGAEYECLAIEGLSVLTPTAESKNFVKLYPAVYSILAWLDDQLSTRIPWREWGDFYIITLRYRPADQ